MVAGQVDGADPEAFKIVDGKLYLRWAKHDVKKWTDKGIAEMRKDIKKADVNWAKLLQLSEDGTKLVLTRNTTGKIILQIGQVDKSNHEFASTGFSYVTEFNCTAGIDCAAATFPMRLYRLSDYPKYADDSGVVRITINFTLDQDYKEVVLRLARAGAETTVVTVDRKRTYLVTNTMLGSNEGYVHGVYDLMLGSFKKGTQTIQLTVADDGIANGSFVWDAIALFAM